MASSDEDTYSSEEHEASFASLEEESSSGSSSSSEYRRDELSDDDDEKEQSNDDEDNLEGLIDPEADRYELKPARLNKSVVDAPPEEPSDASLESFGEEADDTNDQQREDAVVVVDVEEIGDEEDEEIVVVEAEIVVDDDDEDCEEAGTTMQCARFNSDETMILSDESEIQETSVDQLGSGTTELDGPSIRQNDATILDQADSNLLRRSSQMNRGAGFEVSNTPEECQRPDTLPSPSDQISPHQEPATLNSPPRDTHTEKINSPTDKSQASFLESPACETEKEVLTLLASETKRGNVKSPILRRKDGVPSPTGEFLHEPMDIGGSQRSCQNQTCKHSASLQSPTPKTEHGQGFYSLRDNDSSGELKTPSVVEVAGRTPNPTLLYQDDQDSMISAFASLRMEPNLGVTSPPLQSSESVKGYLSGISKPSGEVVSLSGRFLDETNALDQNTQKTQSSKAVKCLGEVNSDVTATSSPTTPKFDTTEKLPPSVVDVNGIKQRSSRIRREGSIKRGQWRLVKKIGSGSFGIVHMGINTHSGSMIAVKSVRMDAIAMKDSKREIQLLKALDHKNVVKYFGAEMNGQHLHIFQEWIPAGSIASLLAMVGPFPLGVLREYLFQVLEGLAYLHENNVVHRDIKGSNLLVTDKGVVKLADFGAGKQLCKLRMESLMAMTCRGTPYFMAPEVFEQNYSAKADIWSVGCVGVQMATGRPPWKDMGFSSHLTLFRHISSITEPPSIEMNADAIVGVHDGQVRFELYKQAVGKCFRLTPTERPSAVELLNDPFFQAERSWSLSDDSECSRLFSPSPGRKSLSPRPLVPANISPILPENQLKSSRESFSSPFLSPPLPPNSKRNSLTPDTSDWPSWAKRSHTNAEKTKAKRYGDDPLNSLSYSYDGQMKENRPDRIDALSTGGNSSALIGLDFVDSTVSSIRAENL